MTVGGDLASPVAAGPADSGRLDVLLIEDNPVDAAMVRALLAEELGAAHRCLQVPSLAAGRAVLVESPPSCVLLDLGLPDSDGLATLNELVSLASDTAIVVLTGLDDDRTGREAVTRGAEDYLVKTQLNATALKRSVLYAIERHRHRAAIQAAHASVLALKTRLQRAFDSAPIGMALVALDGRLMEVNPALVEMTGHPEAHLLSIGMSDTVHADCRGAFVAAFRRLGTGDLTSFREETRLVGRDEREVWAIVAAAMVEDADGNPARVIVQAEDITARKDAEARLLHRTLHDPLTGLCNRTLLHDRLELALARRARGADAVAVLYLDLDRFKHVNDTLGHGCGDRLLVEIGRRLRLAVRPSDTVARLGGDEFVVLAEGVSDGEARQMADRLRAAVAAPMWLAAAEIVPSASVGVALTTDRHCTPEQLLGEADAAMYSEKHRARSGRAGGRR